MVDGILNAETSLKGKCDDQHRQLPIFPIFTLGPGFALEVCLNLINLKLYDNLYFFLVRYNRFGYPVFPQKAFGLPSPSGPVSFAGFSSPVSQVLR